MNTNFFWIGHTIAIAVPVILQPNGLFRIVLTEKITVLIFIAGGNQLFQPQLLKVVAEIMEEIAHTRIIAIAEYYFTIKMCFIVFQFILNIN